MNLTGNPPVENRFGTYSRAISKHHLLLFATAVSALAFLFFSPWVSGLIVGFNVFIVLVAPFFQRFSFFLPIIAKSETTSSAISLTFDDGPEPYVTEKLLDLLAKYSIKATFFVIGEKAAQNPNLVTRMIKDGHEIGNHSQNHDIFLMFRSTNTIYNEISNCQNQLRELGIESYAFRPPVGITNPKLFRILTLLGMYCVGFSCRPIDFGNRRIKNLKGRILRSVKPGDIVLLHDNNPEGTLSIRYWLDQVEDIIIQLGKKGFSIVPLSTLIGRSVIRVNPYIHSSTNHPVKAVFDYLSHQYDSMDFFRQWDSADPFLDDFLALTNRCDEILEIGAGTGRQTCQIANQVKEITATDISEPMINKLADKVSSTETTNISIACTDAALLEFNKKFDKIFSFYCLEYIPDLKPVFGRIYDHLKPGGLLYFTIPNLSIKNRVFRLKTGMKFGLNVHIRRKKEIFRLLTDTKFRCIKEVKPHGISKSSISAFSAKK
ncbi:polysaccharide deacetylase family protein [bacterium]|nr:polysaccharide deacetylase family protein [bacterium]